MIHLLTLPTIVKPATCDSPATWGAWTDADRWIPTEGEPTGPATEDAGWWAAETADDAGADDTPYDNDFDPADEPSDQWLDDLAGEALALTAAESGVKLF